MRLVSPTGTTKKRPIANASATTIVPAHIPPEMSCSSSGSCALAEVTTPLALSAALAGLGHAPLEALYAAAGVDQLLPARVERVAVGADLHVQLSLGRAGDELVAAGAAHVALDVLRVDARLHDETS